MAVIDAQSRCRRLGESNSYTLAGSLRLALLATSSIVQ